MTLADKLEQVSQISHFVSGMCVMFAAKLFLPKRAFWWVFVLWIGYAAVKEFWWDEQFQSPEIRGSGTMDFLVQVAGAAVGVIMLRWRKA